MSILAMMSMKGDYLLRIRNASQIVQISNNHQLVLAGTDMQNISIINATTSSNGLSLIVDNEGNIAAIDTDDAIDSKYGEATYSHTLDASGKSVIPGLVDGHTHPVWEGDRVHEFAMKLAGATYLDVHNQGGGINYTVEKTRGANEERLLATLLSRLARMLAHGTTLLEAKSGYGLDSENELKMLRVIEKAKSLQPIEISSTHCGAHSVPKGITPQEAADDVINKQFPALKEEIVQGRLKVDNVDVFCEKGVFGVEESRQILLAGQAMGLEINFHGDELNPLKSAEMGSALNARAISHLEEISEEGILAMAKSSTIAVLLPTTAYILKLKRPPARKMIEMSIPLALGTDFNPNAYCLSLPMVMHLACVLFNISLEEALVACTLNAAASLNRSLTHGSLEVGKRGDMVVVNAPKWDHIVYQFGETSSVIDCVIIKGKVVYQTKFSDTKCQY